MLRAILQFRLVVVLSVGVLLALTARAGDTVDYQTLGHESFYNLEYEEAIEASQSLVNLRPLDPVAFNDLATAILYKELLRLGKLETKAFKGDNDFLAWDKPTADPKAKKEFETALVRGRNVAEAMLSKNPRDARALYALSTNYGLESTYQLMVDTSYFGAMRNANRADEYSRKLIDSHPGFIDAYLVAGTHEYVVGSLPWAIRYMVAIGGLRGSKEKGKKYVRRVAEEGDMARDSARALLVLLLRREQRPLEAIPVIEGIIRDFPRNYLMHLELAGLYEDAGKDQKALDVFREIHAKVKTNTHRFGRMPARAQQALARKIAEAEKETAVESGGL